MSNTGRRKKKKEDNEKNVINTSPSNVRVLVQTFDRAEQLNNEEIMEFGRTLQAVTTKSAHLWETYGTISNPSFTCVMEQRGTEKTERGGEKKKGSEGVKHKGRAEMAILAHCMRPFPGSW